MQNEAMAIIPIDKTEDNEIMVGGNRFSDDVWDFNDYVLNRTFARTFKKINFTYIHSENIKNVVKLYAQYKLGKVKPRTISSYVARIRPFIKYCEEKGLSSLREIKSPLFMEYLLWSKNTLNHKDSTLYEIAIIVSEIVRIGQIKGWDVTDEMFFSQYMTMGLIKSRRSLAYANKTKPIPIDVFNKILYYALEKEKRVPTKAGIIIQSQTGLRINEVLSIQEGCLSTTSDGYTFLEVEISKTEKGEPIKHKVYANELVVKCVNELSEYTKHLRKKSGLKELFLVNARGTITNSKSNCWTQKRLRTFIRRWDIRDKNGDLYHLQSHQFRATFVRELI